MKTLIKILTWQREHPEVLWSTGAAITLLGELIGAWDEKPGGTISEWFWRLPTALQFFIIWCLGGLFVHFVGWGRVVLAEDK